MAAWEEGFFLGGGDLCLRSGLVGGSLFRVSADDRPISGLIYVVF